MVVTEGTVVSLPLTSHYILGGDRKDVARPQVHYGIQDKYSKTTWESQCAY